MCKAKVETIVFVERNQEAVLSCHMDANPTAGLRFNWTFNTSEVSAVIKVSQIIAFTHHFASL